MSKRVSNKKGSPRLSARRSRTWKRRKEKLYQRRQRRDEAARQAAELEAQRKAEREREEMKRAPEKHKPKPFLRRLRDFFRRRT